MNLDLEEKILDLDDIIKNHAVEFIKKAFTEEKSERAMAEYIRARLEEKEEGKWNVIIGKSFGTSVVHKSRRYGYFQVGEINILVWQAN
jgi:hypothetical protein